MAVRGLVALMVLVVALFLVMEEASDCSNGNGCFYVKAATPTYNQNRKFLHGSKEIFKSFGSSESREEGNGVGVGWDLRRVPSGPDPLHHNGGNPTKPQTP